MNVSVFQLLLPSALAAFLCWIASALMHVVLKYHNSDYQQLHNEDAVADALRAGRPRPALYSLPFCDDMKALEQPEMRKRFEAGPVAMITVMPNGLPPMGRLMAQQVGFFVFGAWLVGYCVSLAFGPGAEYLAVFRMAAAVGFLAYGWGVIPFAIWYGHPWSVTVKYLADALVYGLLTAGAFAWLWPELATG